LKKQQQLYLKIGDVLTAKDATSIMELNDGTILERCINKCRFLGRLFYS